MEIKELILQTNNISETKHFYNITIGFDILNESEKSITFLVGTSKLTFEIVKVEICPKYHFAFNIPVNQLNDAIDWGAKRTSLITNGENLIVADFVNWKAKAFYFFDNNRNILELISRQDLNNSTEKHFSVDSILNINEIGVVNEFPIELGEEIIQKINTNFFVKGPKRPDFVSVGNENGLFVISNDHRNWYPTQERAEKQTVKAKVKIQDREFDLSFN